MRNAFKALFPAPSTEDVLPSGQDAPGRTLPPEVPRLPAPVPGALSRGGPVASQWIQKGFGSSGLSVTLPLQDDTIPG